MPEPNFLTKLGNWIAATGLSNLDGGDNPHPTPKLPGANTYQIYENLNKEDEQAVKDALSIQHDYDKQMAAQKGAVAASALGTGLGVVTAGVIPTAISTATGTTTSYVAGKAGEKLDEHFDTHWISPTMAFIGGLYGGYKGYQLAKPAVIPYLMNNPKQNGILVTREFATDAVADMANRLVRKTPVNNPGLPANVGWAPAQKAYWWHHSNGPITKFKVPFKERWDVVNHDADPNLIWLTKEDGTAGMMAERPYHQQFKVALKKPMVQVGEVQTIPGQKNTSRNAIVKTARDMGADAVIFDGIADNKLQRQQVVAVFGDRNMPTIVPYKSAYYGNFMEGEKFSPLEVTEYFKMGKDAAGKFFEHPVVKAAEEHNIALAKKLGITLHPRPKDISTVVRRPMPLKIHTEGPEAFVAQGHYNDPHAYMSVKWAPVTKEWMNQMGRHEGLHLGFYSAPFRPTNLTHEYYQNVYQPEARFWIMKTDKLLKPEYRIIQNGVIQDSANDVYITDWRGGEAGPNLIDMGRELGLKLGQPYPGDEIFMNMMNNYKGAKSFLLKFLDTDTRAGRRHIWDAMVGKYFAIPAAAAVSSVTSDSNQQNPYKNETRK